MSKPDLPEPWYYQPEMRRRLWLPARAMRNLALLVGYYAGMPALAAAVVVPILWMAAPALVRPLADQYGVVLLGVYGGLILGAVAAVLYRVKYPHNPKALRVLLLLLTGLGAVWGLLYALGGGLGGQVGFLFCLLGVTSYAYVEAAPRESD